LWNIHVSVYLRLAARRYKLQLFSVEKKKQRALQSIEEEPNLEWLREIMSYAT